MCRLHLEAIPVRENVVVEQAVVASGKGYKSMTLASPGGNSPAARTTWSVYSATVRHRLTGMWLCFARAEVKRFSTENIPLLPV
jgi:hypothetical protein